MFSEVLFLFPLTLQFYLATVCYKFSGSIECTSSTVMMEQATTLEKRIEAVCPSAEELGMPVNNNIACPVLGCDKVMKNLPSFKFHLAKTHSIVESAADLKYLNRKSTRYTPKETIDESVEKRFYCPGPSCPYLKDSKKFFKSYPHLRQHYLKLHADKTFHCTQCEARYSTARDLNQHAKECGKSYRCQQCQGVFQKRQSWVNHCRRLNHPRGSDILATEFNSVTPVICRVSPDGGSVKAANTGGVDGSRVDSDGVRGAGVNPDGVKETGVDPGVSQDSIPQDVDARHVPREGTQGGGDKPGIDCDNTVRKNGNADHTPAKTKQDTSPNCGPATTQTADCQTLSVNGKQSANMNLSLINQVDKENNSMMAKNTRDVLSPSIPMNTNLCNKDADGMTAADTTPVGTELKGLPESFTGSSGNSGKSNKQLAIPKTKTSPQAILPKVGYIVIPCVLPGDRNSTNAKPSTSAPWAEKLAKEAVLNFNTLTNKSKRWVQPVVPIAPKQLPSTHPSNGTALETDNQHGLERTSPTKKDKKATGAGKTHAATTQTNLPNKRKKKAVAETQTSGDFILRQAMQSANLPMESRGCQVSPRAKLKQNYSLVTTETQTQGPPRKKAKKQGIMRDSGTKMDTGTDYHKEDSEMVTISVGTDSARILSWQGGLSDSQTQTMALLRDIEASIGESASTQTLESFLAHASQPDQVAIAQPPHAIPEPMTCQTPSIGFKPVCSSNGTSTEDISVIRNMNTPTYVVLESKQSTSSAVESHLFMPVTDGSGQNPALSSVVETQTQCEFPAFPGVQNSALSSGVEMQTQYEVPGVQNSALPSGVEMQTQYEFPVVQNSALPSGVEMQTQYEFPVVQNSALSSGVEMQTQCEFPGVQNSALSSGVEMQTQCEFPGVQNSALPPGVEMQTQCEFPDFPDCLTNNYMNMETQTSIADVFDQLLSNMETQTNTDNDLLSDLGFSHIETQTAADVDPIFSNVETQTGSRRDLVVDDSYVMDMETQTVGTFGFPLSSALADSHTQTTWDDLESFVSKLQ